jgi:hypothetical protein
LNKIDINKYLDIINEFKSNSIFSNRSIYYWVFNIILLIYKP